METNNNFITFELFVDNFKCNKYPIEWMRIKNKGINNNTTVLIIPYSPFIKIKSFQDAIYKQKIILPYSKVDCILKSITNLYNNNNVIFSNTFMKQIKDMNNNTKIKLNISYNLKENELETENDDVPFTFTHLYFLNYLTKFGTVEATRNKMTIETSKEFILNYQTKQEQNEEEEEEEEEKKNNIDNDSLIRL